MKINTNRESQYMNGAIASITGHELVSVIPGHG